MKMSDAPNEFVPPNRTSETIGGDINNILPLPKFNNRASKKIPRLFRKLVSPRHLAVERVFGKNGTIKIWTCDISQTRRSTSASRGRDCSGQCDQCGHVGQYHQLIQQILKFPHQLAFHQRAAEDQCHCHNRIDRCRTLAP